MLSHSSKYALRALLCLAQNDIGEFMRVEKLSEKADISAPYLSKIMKALAKKKIVETRRGLTGGVRLKPGVKEITFHDVCTALGDPITNQTCILSKTKCGSSTPCALHYEWGKVRERIQKFLSQAKIA